MTAWDNSTRLRFGGFVVDLETGELFNHGVKIPLQDKPFQLLTLLVRHPKQLVSRAEIIRRVWSDTYVEGDLCLNVAIRRLRAALQDDSSHPCFVETVGSHGYRFIAAVHGPRSDLAHSRDDRSRLAVLPLKSFAGSTSDVLASSMTDQVITQLRCLNPPFTIITPEFTTERSPKGKSTMALCRNVSANYVLVGAVVRARGQVRITVRLLNCEAQACLWAESYTTSEETIFASQVENSRKIADAIVRAISLALRRSPELVPPRAHENYLQGSSFLSRLTEAATERSILAFEEAVRDCPQFAMAWAALANAHCAQVRLGIVQPGSAFLEIKRCADKALEIESLPDARTALAYYHFLYEHDWNAAEAALVRALAIDSGCSLAFGAYAQLLTAIGRHQDAVDMMRRACDLDPFSGYARIMLGWALYYAGEYDVALSQLTHAMELDASLWIGHTSTGMVLERLGRIDAAVDEFKIAVDHSDRSSLTRAHLAYGLARQGDKAQASEILGSLLSLRQRRYFSPYWIALIHVALDEPSEARHWLEIAKSEHCSWFVFAHEDPKFSALRSDIAAIRM
jgi:DNA-binding winged helix-turn-helix (wHTH) protein/tetratricopeptide (TPR) repeat protein